MCAPSVCNYDVKTSGGLSQWKNLRPGVCLTYESYSMSAPSHNTLLFNAPCPSLALEWSLLTVIVLQCLQTENYSSCLQPQKPGAAQAGSVHVVIIIRMWTSGKGCKGRISLIRHSTSRHRPAGAVCPSGRVSRHLKYSHCRALNLPCGSLSACIWGSWQCEDTLRCYRWSALRWAAWNKWCTVPLGQASVLCLHTYVCMYLITLRNTFVHQVTKEIWSAPLSKHGADCCLKGPWRFCWWNHSNSELFLFSSHFQPSATTAIMPLSTTLNP